MNEETTNLKLNSIPSPLIVDSTSDIFRNRHGSIRLKFVRKHFGVDLSQDKLNSIVELYKTWRDLVEMLPLHKKYKQTNFKDFKSTAVDPDKWINWYNEHTNLIAHRVNDNPECDLVVYEGFTYKWELKKCCKRGNDVYINQLNYKFKDFFNADPKQFFSTAVNDKRKRVRKTRLLYITGTCDHEVTGDMSASWITFGAYWNEFITNLRQQFSEPVINFCEDWISEKNPMGLKFSYIEDGVVYIRAWQSQDNGYPHFHALLYFNDFEFTATFRKEDNSWRIHNRQELNGEPVCNRIKDCWIAGNLDFKCCDNTTTALRDLLKYVLRDLDAGACDLTNAMIWYFGKQSFGISDGFKELFNVNVHSSVEPTNADLINDTHAIQSNNSNLKLVAIEVYPIIRHDFLPNFTQKDITNLDFDEDPPPEVAQFLDNYSFNCKLKKFDVREDGVKIYIYERGENDN